MLDHKLKIENTDFGLVSRANEKVPPSLCEVVMENRGLRSWLAMLHVSPTTSAKYHTSLSPIVADIRLVLRTNWLFILFLKKERLVQSMEINVLSTIICFEVWFLESCEFAPFLREDIFLATRKSVKPKENGKKNTTYSESRACFLAWCQCRISPLQGQVQTYPNFFQVRTTVAEGAFPSKRKERKSSVHSITDNNNKILIQVVILQNYTYCILLLLSISGAKEKRPQTQYQNNLKSQR